jgi:hypothetical protein
MIDPANPILVVNESIRARIIGRLDHVLDLQYPSTDGHDQVWSPLLWRWFGQGVAD